MTQTTACDTALLTMQDDDSHADLSDHDRRTLKYTLEGLADTNILTDDNPVCSLHPQPGFADILVQKDSVERLQFRFYVPTDRSYDATIVPEEPGEAFDHVLGQPTHLSELSDHYASFVDILLEILQSVCDTDPEVTPEDITCTEYADDVSTFAVTVPLAYPNLVAGS